MRAARVGTITKSEASPTAASASCHSECSSAQPTPWVTDKSFLSFLFVEHDVVTANTTTKRSYTRARMRVSGRPVERDAPRPGTVLHGGPPQMPPGAHRVRLPAGGGGRPGRRRGADLWLAA